MTVKRGKDLPRKLLKGIKGLAELNEAIQTRAQHGVINAIDGRPIRLQGKTYAALNYLLQSCGAAICKAWVLKTITYYKHTMLTIGRWHLSMMKCNFQ